jgi:transcriptional regulator with XRE-family HTH domain
MSLTSIDLGLREILSDPIRRQEFFRAITQDDIAEQIRALRKERGLTQTKFAALAEMKQSAVSRIEQAEYASWTLATLFRVAAALDARWRMVLEPAEDAVKEFEGIDGVVQPPAMEAGAEAASRGHTSASALTGSLANVASGVLAVLNGAQLTSGVERGEVQNGLLAFDIINTSESPPGMQIARSDNTLFDALSLTTAEQEEHHV